MLGVQSVLKRKWLGGVEDLGSILEDDGLGLVKQGTKL